MASCRSIHKFVNFQIFNAVRNFHSSHINHKAIRYVDVNNLLAHRKLIGNLTASRIARSMKFVENFDQKFIPNITPINGFTCFMIPRGTVMRAVEYAFCMSFDMCVVALAEGRIFQNGKLVTSHLKPCMKGDLISLYWMDKEGKVLRSQFKVMVKSHMVKMGKRSMYRLRVMRLPAKILPTTSVEKKIFYSNMKLTPTS